jgi:hypothetical protein
MFNVWSFQKNDSIFVMENPLCGFGAKGRNT